MPTITNIDSVLCDTTFNVTPSLIDTTTAATFHLPNLGPIPEIGKNIRVIAVNDSSVYFVATIASGIVNNAISGYDFTAYIIGTKSDETQTTSYSSWHIVADVIGLSPNIVPDYASAQSNVELSLSVEIPLVFHQNLIMAKSAKFDTEDYFIVEGYPVALDGNGAVVSVNAQILETGSTTPVVINKFSPKYYDVTLNSDCRWIGKTDFYPDGIVWSAYSGALKQTLVGNTGNSPLIVSDYNVLVADYTFEDSVMSFENGQFFTNPNKPLSNNYFGILLVATLKSPNNDSNWYGIVSTGNALGTQSDNAPNISLRYYENGTVEFHYKDSQETIALVHGMSNPYKPVVVGFDVDLTTNIARFITMDTKGINVSNINIDHDLGQDSDVFIGAAPSRSGPLYADMAIHEINQYTSYKTQDELFTDLDKLNSIYGVTSK